AAAGRERVATAHDPRRTTQRTGLAALDGGKSEPESLGREAVTVALSLGSDVKAANEAGDSALHTAAAQGYDTVVKYLAEHGADLNVRNKRGLTPLAALVGKGGEGTRRAAAGTRHPSTVDLLRKLGATE